LRRNSCHLGQKGLKVIVQASLCATMRDSWSETVLNAQFSIHIRFVN